MKQAIAFLLVMLLAVGADGIMEAFGSVRFLVIGLAVLGAAAVLIRWGEADEAQPD